MPDHKPVRADDVTDEKLVAGQLRALQVEVRGGFELLTNRLTVMMERFASKQEDHERRIGMLERDRENDRKRLAALEARRVSRSRKGRQ
jgi:hypothetical protein